MNYYIINLETQKLELHFSKEDYLGLLEWEQRRPMQRSKELFRMK